MWIWTGFGAIDVDMCLFWSNSFGRMDIRRSLKEWPDIRPELGSLLLGPMIPYDVWEADLADVGSCCMLVRGSVVARSLLSHCRSLRQLDVRSGGALDRGTDA